jgi:large subunit ribosomal protein L10e
LISIRTKEESIETAKEALRRASMKFPGRQNVVVSKKMGFSNLTHQQYLKAKKEGQIKADGAFCRILSKRGPLKNVLK